MESVKEFYQKSFEGMENTMIIDDYQLELLKKVETFHGSSSNGGRTG